MRIGPVLWRYCHVLRHDGMDYGQYLDQITYLLFLKMRDGAEEAGLLSAWSRLARSHESAILSTYTQILSELGTRSDLVGEIFDGARNEFATDEALAKLVQLIDNTGWNELDRDVQADAFEYLLEQAAAEGKKGAGQYFTPRSLMRVIVECVKPGALDSDEVVADPAAGTGGFLVAASDWVNANSTHPSRLSYWGGELVQRPRRLALMNASLHNLNQPRIEVGDALVRPSPVKADIVLANPPFGTKGGTIPHRPDFWFHTTNKQANFLQHIALSLQQGGRAAVIVPDNCLFGDIASGVMPGLLQRADLHTILRLPDGTFSPYTSGTRTNVLFFNATGPTSRIWMYDARTQLTGTRKTFDAFHSKEFVECYGQDPLDFSQRTRADSPSGRWNQFDIEELSAVDYEPDRLMWRAEVATSETADHLEPLRAARAHVEEALREMNEFMKTLQS